MKTIGLSLLAATMLVGRAAADEAPDRFIAVDGRASMTVEPDIATLQMAISARSAEVDEAREEVAESIRAFLDFIRGQDIEESGVRTFAATVQPEYRWNQAEERRELVGYVVTRQIVVELDEVDKLGEVLEGSVEAGVNEMQPPTLGHSDERELRREVLAAATLDARDNAATIAAALDVALGPVRSITAADNITPPPMPYASANRMALAEADASAGETYATGEMTIEATVSAEFDIEAR